MDQAMEDRIHVITQEKIDNAVKHFVHQGSCDKQHKAVEVTSREVKANIKSLENKLWALVLLALAQLATLVAVLLRMPLVQQ